MKRTAPVLAALFLLCAVAVHAQSENGCPPGSQPTCPFPDPALSVLFPHPTDCHWFFHCSNGVPYCKECPANLHWNKQLDTCDYPYRAGCAVTPCPAGPIPACPYPDPALSVFFPHPNDCNWFFHCSNGVAYCKQCPANLHWNVELNTCDYPYRAGCDLNSNKQ
ncbi:peritrophin-1-like [Periplaneta americana]|uniref:peritrophin-1-like n=1 Tax=Periplaneta americana TaxID=6978 RepID=UPI0037E79811